MLNHEGNLPRAESESLQFENPARPATPKDAILKWLPTAIAGLFLIAICGFLVATSNFGLDVTDEAYYLLMTRYPQDVSGSNSFFYQYGAIPFSLIRYDIATYRILGLFAILISSALFGIEAIRLLFKLFRSSASRSDTSFITILSMIGGTLYYVWFLRSPSYNLFSSVGLYVSLGFIFRALATEMPSFQRTLSFFLCGLFLCIATFCKCTSGVLVSLSILCCVLLRDGWSWREKIYALLAIFCGGALWIVVHLSTICGWQDSIQIFKNSLSHVAALGAGYGLSLFRGYTNQLLAAAGRAVWHLKWAFAFLTVLFFLVLLRGNFFSKKRRCIGSVFVILSGILGSILNRHDFGGLLHLNRVLSAWLAWLMLLSGLLFLWLYFEKDRLILQGRRVIFGSMLIVFLFLLPFISSIGTNNHITQNALFFMSPWLALFGLLTIVLSRCAGIEHFKAIASIFVGALCLGQIYHAGMQSPYRQVAPITQHQHRIPGLRSDSGILLDSATAEYVGELSVLCSKHGFERGGDILALYSQPGIVLLLEGRSPGMPWYSDAYSGFREAQELAFLWAGKGRLERSFILIRPDRVSDVSTSFLKMGIRFPEDYLLCGEVNCPLESPRMQLWRPVRLHSSK